MEKKNFQDVVELMARLRGPEGCPWDREQTPRSLRSNLIEETYEVLDAIERNDPEALKENWATCCCRCCSTPRWRASRGSSRLRTC
jgi:uncharacterized protein YabN with tetrapyrrole methylase and pyrophosphatase domain